MSNKNQHPDSLYRKTQKVRTLLILPLLALLFTLASFISHTTPSIAKTPFSIPSLHSLQKKFFKKGRRRSRRNRRRSKTNRVIAPAILGTQNPLANPPLPVRNPRHKKIAKSKFTTNQRSRHKGPQREIEWSKKSTTGDVPKQVRQKRKLIAPLPNSTQTAGFATIPPPLPVRKPHRHPSKVIEAAWSPEFIRKATMQCATLGIEITPLPPVKKGLCGNPAPVLLQKIGMTTVRPAATLSCPMSASMQQWFNQYVQPLSLKYFGKKVHRIRNVSSYVCRNRYGDSTAKISEHAYANALDIASFELEGGENISVLDDWNNLEGNKSIFLHALHFSACKLFGTVLGPDANAAHKDHFHLDKAPRRRSNYCR